MKDLKIERAKIGDLDDVSKIEDICFSLDAWSREALEEEILNEGLSMVFLAKVDNTTVGYVFIWYIVDTFEIINFAVLPEFRREKIASSIMEKVINLALEEKVESIFLDVRASNQAAIGLYKKFGFYEIDLRKNYYTFPTEDAIVMRREFTYGEK